MADAADEGATVACSATVRCAPGQVCLVRSCALPPCGLPPPTCVTDPCQGKPLACGCAGPLCASVNFCGVDADAGVVNCTTGG